MIEAFHYSAFPIEAQRELKSKAEYIGEEVAHNKITAYSSGMIIDEAVSALHVYIGDMDGSDPNEIGQASAADQLRNDMIMAASESAVNLNPKLDRIGFISDALEGVRKRMELRQAELEIYCAQQPKKEELQKVS